MRGDDYYTIAAHEAGFPPESIHASADKTVCDEPGPAGGPATIGGMRFAKGHASQNDFVLLFDPDGTSGLTAGLAARLCDRRTGLGADGVIRVVRTARSGTGLEQDGWFMDYRNSDGSLAEMCGNGVRLFGRYLAEHGLVAGPEFTVATRAGSRHVSVAAGGSVTVGMGPATITGHGQALVGGQECQGVAVNVGNPHLACLVDGPLGRFQLAEPPLLDPLSWPDGANVELVTVTGPSAIAMRVHERGSGETRSCGTGAIAAVVAAAEADGRRRGEWQVSVPGGTLAVRLEPGQSWLTGPAVIVAEGDLDDGWLAAAEPARAGS